MTWTDPRDHAEWLVDNFLSARLDNAGDAPGLREAVVDGTQGRLEEIKERGRQQFTQLRRPSSTQVPDAYFQDEVVVEEELQRAAAGIRTAQAVEGRLSPDPHRFERILAAHLASPSRWSMLGEASRVPRPSTRPEPLAWSLSPVPWINDESQWPPRHAVGFEGIRHLDDTEPARVDGGPYAGWVHRHYRTPTLIGDFLSSVAGATSHHRGRTRDNGRRATHVASPVRGLPTNHLDCRSRPTRPKR